ncbi:expressed unknown protein [Seminavis robusta]|uniref:Uncharacterized protein n=1 Tax=Seminavis robusta TaxID=568900 RepID=A0A9N8E251_9STRA|nr:expressed unknown protein [Seminavis robusta]|eukprot:Sro572_g168790.1 n/a (190) ;mRNA; r:30992-31561
MDYSTRFTLAAIVFLLLSFVAIATLVYFLRKLTVEYAKLKSDGVEKHWWRFVLPTIVAIAAAVWLDWEGQVWWDYVYFFLVCIAVPMGVTFFVLKETLESKNERMLMLAALLFFLNASIYSCMWYWHYHQAHAEEYESGEIEENPHISHLYWFHIPLWVVTGLVAASAGFVWRREQRKENNELLPYYGA